MHKKVCAARQSQAWPVTAPVTHTYTRAHRQDRADLVARVHDHNLRETITGDGEGERGIKQSADIL